MSLVWKGRYGSLEYRYDTSGPECVLIMHGGHMRADLSVGEQDFRQLGLSVLVPSRPGYGRTSVAPADFSPAVSDLCTALGVSTLGAVVGVSAGGRAAVEFAAQCSDLAERLILLSAVSSDPWPAAPVRLAGRLAFNPLSERLTWAAIRALMRRWPGQGLTFMMASLSTQPASLVLSRMTAGERTQLVDLFSSMRSGRGFWLDLQPPASSSREAEVVQPTLIIASINDGSVPIAHSEQLARTILQARLHRMATDSHLLWYGPNAEQVTGLVRDFLTR